MSESARLNVDVLAVTCKHLTNTSDVLSFAHTCSILRPIAIGWLLSMRPVYIQDGLSVRRFHSFLSVDTPARTPHVRALDIAHPPRTHRLPTLPGDSSLLSSILTSCPRLERISIHIDNDADQCTNDQQIIDAIVGIQTLRSLSIYGWSIRALDLLRGVRAPLHEIDIEFRNDEIDCWTPGALEMFLPHSVAQTLDNLRLCSFITDVDDTQVHVLRNVTSFFRPYTDMTPYPSVRSLHIGGLLRRPLLDHLQHFFPALDGTLYIGSLDMPMSDTLDDLRAANRWAQESSQNGPSHSRAWKRLDKLVCDSRMLYALGLRCAIRIIELIYCSADTKWFAATALHANPVPRLKLFSDFNEPNMLDGLFSPELARTLMHLTTCFTFDNDSDWQSNADRKTIEDQWEDLLNNIQSALEPLYNLTHLQIVVHSSIRNYPDLPVTYSEESMHATCTSIFDFAGTRMAARLARPLPSLQYIFLRISRYVACDDSSRKSDTSWYLKRAWHIANTVGSDACSEDENQPVLVELHDDIAEMIMRNEELFLLRANKA